MKSLATILSLALVSLVHSLDLAKYEEKGLGVDPGFKAYLTEYVRCIFE